MMNSTMFHRILVPLDGSTRAEQAVPVAARLARASGGSITLLRVVTHPHDTMAYLLQPPEKAERTLETQHTQAVDYLAHFAHLKDLADVETALEVADSDPAQTILSAARLQQVDSIVMCSHGAKGFKRWALGSVAQKVARYSPVPVLLLPEGEAQPALLQPGDAPHPLRVLVALDGSALAESTILPAATLCSALSSPERGEICLTLVIPDIESEEEMRSEQVKTMIQNAEDYVEKVKRQFSAELAALQVRVESSVVVGMDAADTLMRLAEQGDKESMGQPFDRCDMIAMATHGRGGVALWAVGSITESVLETTKLPLLIVRS